MVVAEPERPPGPPSQPRRAGPQASGVEPDAVALQVEPSDETASGARLGGKPDRAVIAKRNAAARLAGSRLYPRHGIVGNPAVEGMPDKSTAAIGVVHVAIGAEQAEIQVDAWINALPEDADRSRPIDDAEDPAVVARLAARAR